MEQSTAGLNASEEIRPYRVHVSSKYLELTKKKLELTRLPHDVLLPRAREWEFGTPKGAVEPLIDFWLERYTWRSREETLNTTLPQFRTAISTTSPPTSSLSSQPPLRIHIIHIHSPHPNAIPLLLLPPFPLTNLSLSSSPLFTQLTNPDDPNTQAFHIICPSIPGLGFSDPFTDPDERVLERTAELFDALVQRLGYTYYLASATGAGRESPAGIDYHLIKILGEKYRDSCLGVHVLDPCVEKPRGVLEWMKFSIAKFFHAGIWGYEASDWIALRSSAEIFNTRENKSGSGERNPLLSPSSGGIYHGGTSMLGLREPTTLSYALCDSPVGLLSLICSALQKKSPEHKLSETQIIDLTQLAWLPGPEAGMRFWSMAKTQLSSADNENGNRNERPDSDGNEGGNGYNERRLRSKKPKIAITAFTSPPTPYAPPAWISSTQDLIFAQRVAGKAGLTIWERSEVLVDGIRGLARGVDAVDPRIRERRLMDVVVEGPDGGGRFGGEAVMVEQSGEIEGGLEDVEEEEEDHGMQHDVESPDTVVAVDMS